MDWVVRMMRQIGNPTHMTVKIAGAIIGYHASRKKTRERAQAAIDACMANGMDVWQARDALMAIDTIDALVPHEEKHVTHKQALRMTHSFAALEGADRDKALEMLRRGRNN